MKMNQNITTSFLLMIIFFCCSCHTQQQKGKEDFGKENSIQGDDTTYQTKLIGGDNSEPEPISCMDWLGFYGKETRELDSIINKKSFRVKTEGYDEYNSENKLKGAYVLTDKNMPVEKVGNLAKYLAYKLCLSDNKKFNGILMDCQKRKVQVIIARNEENYTNEAWAVVYNIFPANKKGDLNILDFIK